MKTVVLKKHRLAKWDSSVASEAIPAKEAFS